MQGYESLLINFNFPLYSFIFRFSTQSKNTRRVDVVHLLRRHCNCVFPFQKNISGLREVRKKIPLNDLKVLLSDILCCQHMKTAALLNLFFLFYFTCQFVLQKRADKDAKGH